MGDLVDGGVWQVLEGVEQHVSGFRPDGIRVRVVAFVGDVVFADVLEVLQAEAVVDEAGLEVFAEHIARLLAAEVGVGPGLVMLVDEVRALEEVGDPADAALGQGDLQVRVTLQRFQVQPVGSRVHDGDRHGDDPGVDG
ncbi:hypothetical protein D9M68_663940 [compost metagenome]